jgi:hypothetical protein
VIALLASLAGRAVADVDLVTTAGREGTQLTIYNSEDITMVREHRLLTVKQGINRIQFSWANTLIDPSSIDFRILHRQDVTRPQFRNLRTRYRYRLQNFKTEQGHPLTVPLVIHEHLDGEWIIEKVVLKELTGERNQQVEKEIPHGGLFQIQRIDTGNAEFQMQLPPTTIDKKYDLYVTILRKDRRY